jgi:hypothetical protein
MRTARVQKQWPQGHNLRFPPLVILDRTLFSDRLFDFWTTGPALLDILCRTLKQPYVSSLFALCHSNVLKCWIAGGASLAGSHMVKISEELKAAKAAKTALTVTSTSPKSVVLATLNKANHAAILNLSSGGALNEARSNVGITLSNVIHSQPTPEKIHKAKSAIEAWIRELEASPAA